MIPSRVFACLVNFSRSSLQLTAIVGEELLANRLNMIHAVGRAARVPPRLVTLEYMGAETADEAPIMLVGKVSRRGLGVSHVAVSPCC
jgi:leucyl aminopeptidase